MFAIVDIETTGGRPGADRITEIAIFLYDGERVVEEYNSLVHPGRDIPYNITLLTGISDEMVEQAPTFEEIADEVDRITKGATFVAHNVNFDYGFLRHEFNRAGRKFQRKKLCTVRLSRKIIPGFKSYSLGKLCDKLDIHIENRHRAKGDAEATVALFQILQASDQHDFIQHSLKRASKESVLPPNLPKEKFEQIPAEIGVYFFYDQQGKIIYVGKAKNLQSRVGSHFSGTTNTNRKERFLQAVYDVSYEVCSSELFALLTEAHAIKKHWPIFNSALKRIRLNYGVFEYVDGNGYCRFAIGKSSKTNKALLSFKTEPNAFHRLKELVGEFDLCPRLSGIQYTDEACHDYPIQKCKGACVKAEAPNAYNERFKQAKAALLEPDTSYVLRDKGRNQSEYGVVLVEQGRYKGYGYAPKDCNLKDIEAVREHLSYGYDDQDIQSILETYASAQYVHRINLESASQLQ